MIDASLLTVNRLHLLDVNQQLCIEAAMYADLPLWRLENSLSLEVRLNLPSDHVNGRVKLSDLPRNGSYALPSKYQSQLRILLILHPASTTTPYNGP